MNKELFIAVCDCLAAQVPELEWVDADLGQLDNNAIRPPVAFPCALVDMRYPSCTTLNGGQQRVEVQFTLRVAFRGCGTSAAAAPESVREQALAALDVLEKIHAALQWWNYGRHINPMQRVSVTPERRADGLKVYTLIYTSQFID